MKAHAFLFKAHV